MTPIFTCSRCDAKHCAEFKQFKPSHPEVIETVRMIFVKRWANVEEIRETHPEWYELELSRADFATNAYVTATQDHSRWLFPETMTTSNSANGFVIHCIECTRV